MVESLPDYWFFNSNESFQKSSNNLKSYSFLAVLKLIQLFLVPKPHLMFTIEQTSKALNLITKKFFPSISYPCNFNLLFFPIINFYPSTTKRKIKE